MCATSHIQPGDVFGDLTALSPTDRRYFGSVIWECKCSCGKTCFVAAMNLRSGATKSCGHRKRWTDFTGRRSGRLVAIKPQAKRSGGNIVWLCRCDCGNVSLISSANFIRAKSCGCLTSRNGVTYARCPDCGTRYPIKLDGSATPQFCAVCSSKRAGRNWKVCPVCHKLFASPKSDKTVTCSPECSSKWRSITHQSVCVKWGEEARNRKRADGQTSNLMLGTAAAQQSPIAGRFETNQEAKVWVLVDPSGNEITVRNLLLWARSHAELFNKPPGDRSAAQISGDLRKFRVIDRNR